MKTTMDSIIRIVLFMSGFKVMTDEDIIEGM